MKNKTCGECRYFDEETNLCCRFDDHLAEAYADAEVCKDFTPPTNGDVIRQISNEELMEILTENDIDLAICNFCNSEMCEKQNCKDGVLAWLNAPAEIPVSDAVKTAIEMHEDAYLTDCVKPNAENYTQTDLCKADYTESEGEDE